MTDDAEADEVTDPAVADDEAALLEKTEVRETEGDVIRLRGVLETEDELLDDSSSGTDITLTGVGFVLELSTGRGWGSFTPTEQA